MKKSKVVSVFLLILVLKCNGQGLGEFARILGIQPPGPLNLKNVYDFVVVGAGSAGSVVASRLSEFFDVLLLEAGQEETFFNDVPLLAPSFADKNNPYNWGYSSESSNYSCLAYINRQCNLPRGKALGGTSVINFLVYTRGNKLDYDEWGLTNPGWSYEDVLPYFIRSENASLELGDDARYHGRNGPVSVEHPPFQTPILNQFLQAGKLRGYEIRDPNGKGHVGFSKTQATMRNGRRHSTASAYLAPIRNRPTLKIVTGARVTKILIDPASKQAYGVIFVKGDEKFRVKASKEVILSAGAFNSPQLLMLSGIGPSDHLRRFNIPVIKDLPVGYNLQDHVAVAQNVLINESVTVNDFSVLLRPDVLLNYISSGRGPLTIPGGAEGIGFVKTKYSREDDDYPDIELVLAASGINHDLFGFYQRISGFRRSLYQTMFGPISGLPSFSLNPILMRPKSRGRVLLKSANPLVLPEIHMNFLEENIDVKVLVEGMKMAINLVESPSFRRYNARPYIPFIPSCKKGYKFASDEYLGCVIRHICSTLGHHVGTCKMGPEEDASSVVDATLRVKGITGLRVVDGSVMPNIVAGHTNSVIMMIGEKAADMIKNSWVEQDN